MDNNHGVMKIICKKHSLKVQPSSFQQLMLECTSEEKVPIPTSKAKVKHFFISLILTLCGQFYTAIERRFGRSLNGLNKDDVSEFIESAIQRDVEDLWTRYKSSAFRVIADIFEIEEATARALFVQKYLQANGRGGRWEVDPNVLDALQGGDADEKRTAEQNKFRQKYSELCARVCKELGKNPIVTKRFFIGLLLNLCNEPEETVERRFGRSLNGLNKDDVSEFIEGTIQRDVEDLWTLEYASAFRVIADIFEIEEATARALFGQKYLQANGRGGRWEVDPNVLNALRGGDADEKRTAEQNKFTQSHDELRVMMKKVLGSSCETAVEQVVNKPDLTYIPTDCNLEESMCKELMQLPSGDILLEDYHLSPMLTLPSDEDLEMYYVEKYLVFEEPQEYEAEGAS